MAERGAKSALEPAKCWAVVLGLQVTAAGAHAATGERSAIVSTRALLMQVQMTRGESPAHRASQSNSTCQPQPFFGVRLSGVKHWSQHVPARLLLWVRASPQRGQIMLARCTRPAVRRSFMRARWACAFEVLAIRILY